MSSPSHLSPSVNSWPLYSTCVEETVFCWDVRISVSLIGPDIGRLSWAQVRVGFGGMHPAEMASR